MSYRVGKYLLLMLYIDFLPIRACLSRQHILDYKSGKPCVILCESKRVIHIVVYHIQVAGYESYVTTFVTRSKTTLGEGGDSGPHDYVCVITRTWKSLSMSDKFQCHFGLLVSWLGIKGARFLSFSNLPSSTLPSTQKPIYTPPTHIFLLFLLLILLYLLLVPSYIFFLYLLIIFFLHPLLIFSFYLYSLTNIHVLHVIHGLSISMAIIWQLWIQWISIDIYDTRRTMTPISWIFNYLFLRVYIYYI